MPTNNDAYQSYMAEMQNYKQITRDKEAELSRIIQGDDLEAAETAVNELVESNLLLVVHCATEYRRFTDMPSCRLSKLDLIAEGNVALLDAAKHFDVDYRLNNPDLESNEPVKFCTYACKCIKSRMRRALKKARLIRVPEYHFSYWSEISALEAEHGDEIPDSLIMENVDISPSTLKLVKESRASDVCMLEDMFDLEGSAGWADVIPSNDTISPGREVALHDMHDFLLTEMQHLPDRAQEMICSVFLSDTRASLGSLSERFGVSRERCRQVCAWGLNKMRKGIEEKLNAGIEPAMIDTGEICAA